MKSRKMLETLVVALGLMVCLSITSRAAPMGTAWTYQGRLLDANDTADGFYDFEFALFDQESNGNQMGSVFGVDDVNVVDGYFSVLLDFGNVFNGIRLWLETAVRPGESKWAICRKTSQFPGTTRPPPPWNTTAT